MPEKTKGDIETHFIEVVLCDADNEKECEYVDDVTFVTKYRNIHKLTKVCEKQMIFKPSMCDCPLRKEARLNITIVRMPLERRINNVKKRKPE